MNIKQISIKYSIPSSTLRYWEKVGVIPSINRSSSGYREYDEEDERWIYWTMCMRDAGVEVTHIIKYIELFKKGKITVSERKSLLEKQLNVIADKQKKLNTTYQLLRNKIINYEDDMLRYEGKLKI